MTTRILSGLALGLLLAGAANAECTYPKEPANTPDGATATQDQMVDGMTAVKEYNGAVTAYLSCLEQEMATRIEAAGPDAPAEQIEQIKAIHTKRHNAAVEALEQHAARFNEQVKAFKSREKKS
jgi:outer membrane murein-binding lipoprotein Lpp